MGIDWHAYQAKKKAKWLQQYVISVPSSPGDYRVCDDGRMEVMNEQGEWVPVPSLSASFDLGFTVQRTITEAGADLPAGAVVSLGADGTAYRVPVPSLFLGPLLVPEASEDAPPSAQAPPGPVIGHRAIVRPGEPEV